MRPTATGFLKSGDSAFAVQQKVRRDKPDIVPAVGNIVLSRAKHPSAYQTWAPMKRVANIATVGRSENVALVHKVASFCLTEGAYILIMAVAVRRSTRKKQY